MPTTFLNQVPTSHTALGVTYTFANSGFGKQYGNPWTVLNATGTPVSSYTEPHITIWGNNNNRITTVEFTWAGSYHLEYRVNRRTIYAKHIPGSEGTNAVALETLLIGFLKGIQVPGSNNITRAFSEKAAETTTTAPKVFNLNSDKDFPALGS